MSIVYPSLSISRSTNSKWSFSDNVLPNAGVFDMSVRSGGSVVSSPIEEGSFASYNKTVEPLEITATLSFEGTNTRLQSVQSNLKKLKESVTIFSIVTPTYEFENMTLESYDFSFTREQGIGALYVNAVFKEIKEVTVSYTEQQTITQESSSDASAVSEVSEGNVSTTSESSMSSSEQSAGEASSSKVSVLKSMENYGYIP